MKDIVRILEDIATEKGITYHYGKKAALNLLDGSAEAGTTYLLHEYTRRRSEYNSSGTKITAANYEGKFFLVRHSDYDRQYFRETGIAENSKYETDIAPLLSVFEEIGNALGCLDATVQLWENIDVTDALDANMDGLLCSYKIQIPLNYD